MAIQWRIYYDDGSTFSNQDGELKDAPAFGVQAIVCQPEVWGCGDIVGLIDYLARSGIVKFGRLTTNQIYDSVVKKAMDDDDFDQRNRQVCIRGDYYWFNG